MKILQAIRVPSLLDMSAYFVNNFTLQVFRYAVSECKNGEDQSTVPHPSIGIPLTLYRPESPCAERVCRRERYIQDFEVVP